MTTETLEMSTEKKKTDTTEGWKNLQKDPDKMDTNFPEK